MDILINIDVPDLPQAIRFYELAAGLRLCRKLFDGTVAEMVGTSAMIRPRLPGPLTPQKRSAGHPGYNCLNRSAERRHTAMLVGSA
jgi:hypothetical protein